MLRWMGGALLAACVCSLAPAQTIYMTHDKNGVPVYSDRAPADGKVEKTYTYEYLPSSPLPALPGGSAAPNATAPARASTGQLVASTKVTLFEASWCGYCKNAERYLAQHGIPYDDVNVDTPSGRYAYTMAGGKAGVPLLVVGTRRVIGFSAKGYDAVFAAR